MNCAQPPKGETPQFSRTDTHPGSPLPPDVEVVALFSPCLFSTVLFHPAVAVVAVACFAAVVALAVSVTVFDGVVFPPL